MNTLKSFYSSQPVVRYKKGQIILHQDEAPDYVFAIKSGVVEVYNYNHNGEHRSISFETEYDILPTSWSFSPTSLSIYYHAAYTDCELYKIKKSDFIAKLRTNPKFALDILDLVITTETAMTMQVDALSKTNIQMKLLYMFRFFCLRYGCRLNNGLVKIQIPLTQQKLSEFIGASREATTTTLQRLKLSKIIDWHHRYYYIDTKKVSDNIDDEYDPGINVYALSASSNHCLP